MKVEQAAQQLEALGNPTRLQVYRTLVRAGPNGLPVSRVQEKLNIPASTLSHHLHRLILTELVTQERQATTLICRANYPAMDFPLIGAAMARLPVESVILDGEAVCLLEDGRPDLHALRSRHACGGPVERQRRALVLQTHPS